MAPGPLWTDAGKGSWAQFLGSHAQSLWQCDFFSKNTITAEGIRQCFALAVLHVSTRKLWLSHSTSITNGRWLPPDDRADALRLLGREVFRAHGITL